MRPGSRWNGEAANPIAAAIVGAVVSLAVSYGLSYLFQLARLGVISGHGSWHSRNLLLRAALNLYAAHHVALIGFGVQPDVGPIHATIDFPLTVWATIPAFSLILGGFIAAQMRSPAGRWGMIATTLGSAIIYVAVLTALSGAVSATFTSAALPVIRETEFNPPGIPFKPSTHATLAYGLLFAIVLSYVGALIAVRRAPGLAIKGKWWACAKAVVIVALAMQALFIGAVWGWFAVSSHSNAADEYAQLEIAQSLPTVVGIAYSLVHGARLSYAAVPVTMPSESYSGNIGLYTGISALDRGKLTHKSLRRYAWIPALLGALAAFASGRLAVKMGSRDGSLPTALRILVLQSAFIAATMLFCAMGWGIAWQFRFFVHPRFDSTMLYVGGGIMIFALVGAHWANRRYSGRLSGFPSV